MNYIQEKNCASVRSRASKTDCDWPIFFNSTQTCVCSKLSQNPQQDRLSKSGKIGFTISKFIYYSYSITSIHNIDSFITNLQKTDIYKLFQRRLFSLALKPEATLNVEPMIFLRSIWQIHIDFCRSLWRIFTDVLNILICGFLDHMALYL